MKKLLWLDDIRNPLENNWLNFSPIEQPFECIWVKSYKDFVNFIKENGLPDAICFDHDLGEDVASELVSKGINKKEARRKKKELPTGYDCAKWLVDYCIKNNKKIPLFNIQSANPVGAENIRSLLNNANKHI
jgi:hypothetical protein